MGQRVKYFVFGFLTAVVLIVVAAQFLGNTINATFTEVDRALNEEPAKK